MLVKAPNPQKKSVCIAKKRSKSYSRYSHKRKNYKSILPYFKKSSNSKSLIQIAKKVDDKLELVPVSRKESEKSDAFRQYKLIKINDNTQVNNLVVEKQISKNNIINVDKTDDQSLFFESDQQMFSNYEDNDLLSLDTNNYTFSNYQHYPDFEILTEDFLDVENVMYPNIYLDKFNYEKKIRVSGICSNRPIPNRDLVENVDYVGWEDEYFRKALKTNTIDKCSICGLSYNGQKKWILIIFVGIVMCTKHYVGID